MAHRRFRGRGISDSQRRKKAWIGLKQLVPGTPGSGDGSFTTSIKLTTPIGSGSTAPGNFSSAIAAFISDPDPQIGEEASTLPEECTILRARGSLLFPKTVPGTVANQIDIQHSFGFGVTDIRSIASGIAPGPILDVDWDGWMFLRQSTVAPVDSVGSAVDVKAMRKIKTGDAFFVAATAMDVAGGAFVPTADWIFDLRLLILLP